MTRLERLEAGLAMLPRRGAKKAPGDVEFALAMLREAETHLEKHICHGHPCAVCAWKAKLREETK